MLLVKPLEPDETAPIAQRLDAPWMRRDTLRKQHNTPHPRWWRQYRGEQTVRKRRDDKPVVGRRNFLKGAGLVGAAALTPAAAKAQAIAPKVNLKAALPGPAQLAADTLPPTKDSVTQSSSGGDFMVDVFRSLDIDYLAMNCASSFRGLHEAVLNHGKNVKPEILTTYQAQWKDLKSAEIQTAVMPKLRQGL